MNTDKKHRHSKKALFLQKIALIALLAAAATLCIRQGMDDPNLGIVTAIFVFFVAFLSTGLYVWQALKHKV